MKKMDVHFSSKSDEWETPHDFFKKLDDEFHFELDPCSTVQNAKCVFCYTKSHNGLEQEWHGRTTYTNPPYSQLREWVAKCALEASKGATVVMLIPSRTDTKAFHEHIWDAAKNSPRPGVELRFIKGRLKFGGSKNSAPFPSLVVIFRKP